MKRLLGFLIAFISIFILQTQIVSAQNVNNYFIESFDADYYLSQDGGRVSQLRVEETIVVRFPNFDQNHGILRAIPKTYQDNSVGFKIESVTDERGVKRNYTASEQNDNEVLKIGDADSFVRGRQVYKIVYTSEDVINFQDDGDEFYWDINGDQWPVQFNKVTARIHVSEELAKSLQDRKVCFAGGFGENNVDCNISKEVTEGEVVFTASALNLAPSETLTTVIGFEKDTFSAKPFPWLLLLVGVSVLVFPPILAFIIVLHKWRTKGRDDQGKGIVIPQYVPEKGSNVVIGDVLVNEKLNPKTLSAAVIELATTNHIVITEKGNKEYEFELIKPYTKNDELKEVMDMIFGVGASTGKVIELKSLKNKLFPKIKKLDKDVFKRLTKEEYFKHGSNLTKKRMGIVGTVLFVVAFLLFFIPLIGFLFGFSLLISAIIFVIGSNVMAARTHKGTEARNYLLGIKEYINLAEVDRIEYLQTPEAVKRFGDIKDGKVKIKLFEKLLPYAMLFGLEKQWAKDFKDIYQEPPDWYHGNWTTFNAVNLTNSLNGFSSASGTAFSPPKSSSGSGFSGGGGSSGGGGGGGGGGGW
ncbi:MAG: DUF2207 domain-containing protein [bacterium]|nr:DUF2207 domain-containing protein [bacterium]